MSRIDESWRAGWRLVLLALLPLSQASCGSRPSNDGDADRAEPSSHGSSLASIDLTDESWWQPALSYSGYRVGQVPEIERPSLAEIREDLQIISRKWHLIRLYSADAYGKDVLRIIRQEEFPVRVMLGIWLAKEPKDQEGNEAEVSEAIRLANEYPEIVVAVNVGNEALIDWTSHPVPEDRVIQYVRQVRSSIQQPVTVADNYVYWRDFGSRMADELDFITVHTYPMWERMTIDQALDYTRQNIAEVKAALPGKRIVIGEAGWASYSRGNLHVPRAGNEVDQKRHFFDLMEWAQGERIVTFWFSAFDEPWKGEGTEGYWGLFSESRHPKLAMHEWYPDLVAEKPTSPNYEDHPDPTEGFPGLEVILREGQPDVPTAVITLHGARDDVVSVAVDDDGYPTGPSLVLTHSGTDFGGVYFIFDSSLNLADSRSIEFALRLPEGIASLELKLEDSEGGTATVNALDYRVPEQTDSEWTLFSVPIGEFAGVDLDKVAFLGFWHPKNEAGAFLQSELGIDDLAF